MIIVYSIIFILLLTFAYGSIMAAPWVPMHARDIQRVVTLACIKPGDRFVDLGCGDGRMVIAAARAGAYAVGYEVSLLPYMIAQIRRWCSGVHDQCEIRYGNFWNKDLHEYTVVYFFLMPKIYSRLETKLANQISTHARVIAYVWPLPHVTASQIDQHLGTPAIYVYDAKSFETIVE